MPSDDAQSAHGTERLHVDLGTGLGGWTAPFRDASRWRSVGIDIRDDLNADVVGDIRRLPLDCSLTLLTMSPPCTDFARWMLPWLHEPNPDLSLVEACLDAVDELDPDWWVLENSRGLSMYWREADQHVGPYYLWGNLPPVDVTLTDGGKMSVSGVNPEERAEIPYELADGVRRAVEGQRKLVTDGGTDTSGTKRTGRKFSAFPYIGSKTYLAPWIVDHLRAHDNFVVPFGGAAGVILNKPRSGCEIYNDRDDDLVEFFRACREHPDELAERVRNIPFSRSLYDEWSQQFRSGDGWPDNVVERAARWVYLRYASFSGRYGQRAGFATDTPRGGPQKSRIWQQMPDRIWTIRDRFRGVSIECLDYSEILGRYDDPDMETLYYCDPPYTEAKSDYYRGPDFDHERFVDDLASVDGHWIVSYMEPPAGLEDLATAVVERTYNRSAGEQNEDRTERLYLSYEPHTVPMFVDDSTSQQTLVAATDGGNSRAVDTDTEQSEGER